MVRGKMLPRTAGNLYTHWPGPGGHSSHTYEWLAATGRFNTLLVRSPNLTVKLNGEYLLLENSKTLEWPDTEIYIVDKPHHASIAPKLDALRYSQLFRPFAYLARLVEALLVFIQANLFHKLGPSN
jgi:hypothetical protein